MDSDNSKKFVITIGRQFGSGGREIGKLVAEKLNIKYYDKELLAAAAQASGVKPEFFEATDERTPKFFSNSNLWSFNIGYNVGAFFIGDSPLTDDSLYRAQSEAIKNFAGTSSCVIVGRSADYVLRDYPALISVFIHASLDACVKRIIERCDCKDENQARNLALKKNKLRANYYNFYTDKTWGEAMSYDLAIDSSSITSQQAADLIVAYVKMRINP